MGKSVNEREVIFNLFELNIIIDALRVIRELWLHLRLAIDMHVNGLSIDTVRCSSHRRQNRGHWDVEYAAKSCHILFMILRWKLSASPFTTHVAMTRINWACFLFDTLIKHSLKAQQITEVYFLHSSSCFMRCISNKVHLLEHEIMLQKQFVECRFERSQSKLLFIVMISE